MDMSHYKPWDWLAVLFVLILISWYLKGQYIGFSIPIYLLFHIYVVFFKKVIDFFMKPF